MRPIYCLLASLCLWASVSQAQIKTINGKVVDIRTRKVVPGVSILAKANSKAAITGYGGAFKIDISKNDTFYINADGYVATSRPVTVDAPDCPLLIQLVPAGPLKKRTAVVKATKREHGPLKVGDIVPELVFTNTLNHPRPSMHLSETAGSPTILLFFATWCSACHMAIQKLITIGEGPAAKFKVLLISSTIKDNVSKVRFMLSDLEKRTGRKIGFPAIIGDTMAEHLFPHKVIPHVVWLDANKKVVAISGGDALTESNIAAFTSRKNISYEPKDDAAAIEPTFPLQGILGRLEAPVPWSGSFFSGYLRGVNEWVGNMTDGAGQHWYAINQDIAMLYRFASGYNFNRIEFATRRFLAGEAQVRDPGWKRENLFSYGMDLSSTIDDSSRQHWMVADLNRNLQLDARFEMRSKPCWLVTGTATKNPIDTNGVWSDIAQLVKAFNANSGNYGFGDLNIAVDATNGMEAQKIKVPRGATTSLAAFRNALIAVGLSLAPAVRDIPMLVIYDPLPIPLNTKTNNP